VQQEVSEPVDAADVGEAKVVGGREGMGGGGVGFEALPLLKVNNDAAHVLEADHQSGVEPAGVHEGGEAAEEAAREGNGFGIWFVFGGFDGFIGVDDARKVRGLERAPGVKDVAAKLASEGWQDGERGSTYKAMPVARPGDWRVLLMPPRSSTNLTRFFQCSIPGRIVV
jgi:hypothetical protein